MRVLVAHASGYGATQEVAKEIAGVLAHEHQVDLHPLGQVKSLEAYDAVVIGSSFRAGRWLGAMNRFLGRFQAELSRKLVVIFTVCLTARTQEGSRRVVGEFMPKLLARFPEVKPLTTEAFGGVLDFQRYSPVLRAMMRRVATQEGLPTAGLQDFRDWQAIRQWAQDLSRQLTQPAPQRP